MLKKLFCILMCMLVVVHGISLVAYAVEDDITGHWSEPYFRYLSAHGVINANGKGHFTPTTAISRAEFMRYINRAFGFTEKADISQYKDVASNQWYYEAVQIAVKYGYISGVSQTQMAPEKEITREQAITVLGRLCKVDVGNIKPSQLKFSDRSKVSAWSAPYIQWGVDNGYIAGYTNNTFQPQRSVTRGEAAKILYYFTGTILNQSGAAYNATSLNKDTQNVTVSSSSTLSEMTVSGNLYLSEGLKQDTVTLSNVTVKGRLIVAGGNIQMNNVQAGEVYISSPFTDREVRVTSVGATSIPKVTAATTAQLIQTSLQTGADGFKHVTVTGDKDAPVTLNGRFADVTLTGKNRLIVLPGAYVKNVNVQGAATIGGSGIIQNAIFSASGAVSEIEPVTYSFSKGVTATLKGVLTANNRTQPNHILSPGTVQLNMPNDVVFVITSDDNAVVRSVMLGNRTLENGTQYIYDHVTGSIRLFASAFQGLPNGTYTVQAMMSSGVNPTAVINFSGNTPSPPQPQQPPQPPPPPPPPPDNVEQNANLSAQFSRTPGHAANQNVVFSPQIDSNIVIQAVLLDGRQLVMPVQYNLDNNQVILNKEALMALTVGKKGNVSVSMILSNGQTISAQITLI